MIYMPNKKSIAGRPNNRIRILFVEDYFRHNVGRWVKTSDIVKALLTEYPAEYTGNAEGLYKYIYEDIKTLNERYGGIIESIRGKGYRIVERMDGITETELNLIRSLILKSKRLTRKDKESIVNKLFLEYVSIPEERTTAENIDWIIDRCLKDEPMIISFDYRVQEATKDMDFLSGLKDKYERFKVMPMHLQEDILLAYDTINGHLDTFYVSRMKKLRVETEHLREEIFNEYMNRINDDDKEYIDSYRLITFRVEKRIVPELIKDIGHPDSQHNDPTDENMCIMQIKIPKQYTYELFDRAVVNRMFTIISPDEVIEEYKAYLQEEIDKYK